MTTILAYYILQATCHCSVMEMSDAFLDQCVSDVIWSSTLLCSPAAHHEGGHCWPKDLQLLKQFLRHSAAF